MWPFFHFFNWLYNNNCCWLQVIETCAHKIVKILSIITWHRSMHVSFVIDNWIICFFSFHLVLWYVWHLLPKIFNLFGTLNIWPFSQKHFCKTAQKVPVAASALSTPLARRYACHTSTWHGPIQQGAMSTQNPQTWF